MTVPTPFADELQGLCTERVSPARRGEPAARVDVGFAWLPVPPAHGCHKVGPPPRLVTVVTQCHFGFATVTRLDRRVY